jgi:hydroxyacylglutathione hydrolase
MTRSEFKAIVTAEQPEAPAYFSHDAMLNRQEHVSLGATLKNSRRELGVDDLLRLRDARAQLLDTRSGIDFEGAHLVGALNIPIDGKYATWCGTLLNHDNAIVLIADPGREEEAIVRLGRIGFDNVAGFLNNGMDALKDHPSLVRRIDRITAIALADQLGATDAPLVVDVRSEKEWAAGHIVNSLNVPLNHLRERLNRLPEDRRLAVHCEGGYRSVIAASILAGAGRPLVFDLVGGYRAWVASKLPVI